MGCGAATSKKAEGQQQTVPPKTEQHDRPEVPPRKLVALKEAFKSIDTNDSGRIDASEMEGLLTKVGQDDLSDEDRSGILKAIDKNEDSKIEFREFVEWVLEREGGNDAVANWSLNKGLSDIHRAAIAGDGDKIRSLCDAGAKVNCGDFNDVTPLHYAARVGKLSAAQALLEKKADLSVRTSDTKRMPIHAAAENGSVEVVKLLLEHRAELDATDGRLRTPLHWAACSSREQAAAELLRVKADVNVKSSAGYTPFAMAQDWSTTPLANLIAQYGGKR